MKLLKMFCLSMAVFFNINCGEAQNSKVTNLAPAEFVKEYQTTPNAQLLDVRTPGEWQQSNVATATKCDFNSPDFKQSAVKLDKNKPVFVYCAAGGRSAKAAKILEELGFTKIVNLKGGGNADLINAGLK